MARLDWLHRTLVESGASLLTFRNPLLKKRMRRRKAVACNPVESLEDRTLLTAFVVNTTSDDADDAAGVADGQISLREAIIAANTNAAFGDAPAGSITGDSIRFDPSVFSGSEAARTISMMNGAFVISDDLRITGVAEDVILDAGGTDRVFRIVSNEFTRLQDLTIRNGASDATGGGGMRITGTGRTILSRVTIENSTSPARGGGILVIGATLETFDTRILNNSSALGGGLANVNGIVTLNRTLVQSNTSTGQGGGLSNDGGRLILRDSVVSLNSAQAMPGLRGGGGIHNSNNGRLAITNSDVVRNRAESSRGGGLFSESGAVTITDSRISNNFAGLSGGGIEIVDGRLEFLSSLLGGLGAGSGNVAGAPGTSANGGGLHNSGTAFVHIEDSMVQYNEATGEGGGLWNSRRGTLVVRGGAPPIVTSINEAVTLDPATLQTTVDQFRTQLGTNNGGVPGSQGTGRREINWDAAPDSVSTPNSLPEDFFNQSLSPLARGVEFSTPGTGFQLSATNASNVGTVFSNLNPNYTQTFRTFSPERLFTPIGSNVTVVDFFIPGTNTPAVVSGFGAVFSDVDVAGATKIEFFDVNGKLLLSRSVMEIDAQRSLSFLGATFSFPVVAQVRITTGTGTLGPKDISQNGPVDVVVLDDFIYGEPVTPASVDTNTIVHANTAGGSDSNQGGGGIFNAGGRVSIFDITISDNLADGARGSGGGILSTGGTLSIEEATISGNDSARAGGGIELIDGRVDIIDSILDGNETGLLPFGQPTPGNGGGLHVTGSAFVRVNGGRVQNNVAAREGGGLWNSASGVMIVDGVRISNNTALGDQAHDGGGGIFNSGGRLILDNSVLTGNRATGTSGSGGGLFSLGGGTTIDNSIFDNNLANRAGGGIEARDARVFLVDTTLRGNRAGDAGVGNPGNGGGLHSTGRSRVELTAGLIEANVAVNEGGGLWNSAEGLMILRGGTAIRNNVAIGDDIRDGGGGLFNNGGRLAITETEISGNTAFGPGSSGGGLLSVAGAVTIENSTISGNTANSAGGGISNFGLLISTNNTIVRNISNPDGTQIDGGGVYTGAGGTTRLQNTIVAGNLTRTETRGRPRGSDIGGTGSVGASRFNLIGDANSSGTLVDGVNNNIVGMSGMGQIPLSSILDVNLTDNGGPTQTHALTFSSLAINNGSNDLAVNSAGQALTTDQRGPGFPRIFNSRVDIGAFER